MANNENDTFHDDLSEMRKIVERINKGLPTLDRPKAAAFAAAGSTTATVEPPNMPVWEDAEAIDFSVITAGFVQALAEMAAGND